MKIIKLKKLDISNFKGISKLEIEFAESTSILGANALGKTSIFDAFTWLLFDKNSKGDSKFELKPLDSNNNYIRGLNPCVTGVLEIDGINIKLSKEYKEKWTSRRGESEKTFDGNTTKYEIDDIPVKKSDYQNKIKEIADEDMFKLLTNPFQFPSLNWKEQRNVIMQVVGGDINVEDVIALDDSFKIIKAELLREDVSKLIESKKGTIKKLKDSKKEIPSRIQELMELVEDIDINKLEADKVAKENIIKDIDEQLSNISKRNAVFVEEEKERISKQFENIAYLEKLESEERKAFDEALRAKNVELQKLEENFNKNKRNEVELNEYINDLSKKFEKIQIEVNDLRKQYNEIQNESFDENKIEKECPLCKREFDFEYLFAKKTELESNFKKYKEEKIKEVTEKGTNKSAELKQLQSSIESHKSELQKISKEQKIGKDTIETITKHISEMTFIPSEIFEREKERIEAENNKITAIKLDDKIDNTELLAKKEAAQNELKQIYNSIGRFNSNKKALERIEELKENEKQIGIDIAREEKILMLYEKFITKRVELLEKSINKNFDYVSFKLFATQVNGAINETCEATINGVPFSNANTAAQINAGIDIINTLSDYYQLSVPIFIDNSECVNKITDTKGQLIKLVVTKDKNLKVLAGENE